MSTPNKILLVGHCTPDSSMLHIAAKKAAPDAAVLRVNDTASLAREIPTARLLLINRVLEPGFDTEQGLALLKQLRKSHPTVNAMLVSNFPEAQAQAIADGALPGFGKDDLRTPRAVQILRDALTA